MARVRFLVDEPIIYVSTCIFVYVCTHVRMYVRTYKKSVSARARVRANPCARERIRNDGVSESDWES